MSLGPKAKYLIRLYFWGFLPSLHSINNCMDGSRLRSQGCCLTACEKDVGMHGALPICWPLLSCMQTRLLIPQSQNPFIGNNTIMNTVRIPPFLDCDKRVNSKMNYNLIPVLEWARVITLCNQDAKFPLNLCIVDTMCMLWLVKPNTESMPL